MAGDLFAFGPFQLDPHARQLTRDGEPIALSSRQIELLLLMVLRAGQVLSKDALIAAAWEGIAVTDNSVEQAISALRRCLATPGASPFIETVPRRGYRFSGNVTRIERRESAVTLEALLAPHRAWVEGRAALETLERDHILRAREVFQQIVQQVPDQASAHVGLANACVMQFEMTRADRAPDRDSLAVAAAHAQEACRLDPGYGEAWATLGFVLARAGEADHAIAASQRAVSLEPDNWRHHVRLAYVTWGEPRLRAARRVLALLPGFPLAHWLASTVLIARQALGDAERELAAGIASLEHQRAQARFNGVALHWLYGLLRLAEGDETSALQHFERELAGEGSGQLYARECCANTWYAIGAVRLRHGDRKAAAAAFQEAVNRVPMHPLACAGLVAAAAAERPPGGPAPTRVTTTTSTPDVALPLAVLSAAHGDVAHAVHIVESTLDAAPPGSALWLLALEPMLQVGRSPGVWEPALARLRNRAA